VERIRQKVAHHLHVYYLDLKREKASQGETIEFVCEHRPPTSSLKVTGRSKEVTSEVA
jgi:hypothetical protein